MSTRLEAIWDRLGQAVTQWMDQKEVPGVAVGMLHQGETFTAGFGVTNVDHPLPVTDETLFQIGSITKTFTGTAIMRLVEAGKLDLDAPVRTTLPEFRVSDEEASAGATLRHLLSHMGGWAGDFFHDTGAGDDALARYVADMAELPQLAPLGSVWSYNNAGFSLAGHLIEVVTGKSYEAALQELVLDPLGLEQCFLDPGDVITHRFAVGHNVGDQGAQVARPWPLVRSIYPAGGIVCSVRELLRYARFHLGDGTADGGTRLLAPESMAQMQTRHATVWKDEGWGLAWELRTVGETLQAGHGGGTKGQVSHLALVPEHGFAVATLTNADRGGFLTKEVRRWALREILGIDVPEPGPIQASEEELAQVVGRYQGFYDDLELGMLGGKLVGQVTYKRGFPSEDVAPPPAPPPMSAALCEEDRLLVLDGPAKGAQAEVIRTPDGAIGWLRVSRRLHVRDA
jgi:CubicO group peptidase (beta-lactamase class C family)